MRTLGLLALVCCLWLVQSKAGEKHGSSNQIENDPFKWPSYLNGKSGRMAVHSRKKRFWGAIIGGVISIAGKLLGRGSANNAAANYEKQMGFQLEQLCYKICVTEWSPWSQCSKPCGGGTAKRTRKHQLPGKCKGLSGFTCPHGTSQVSGCNMGCPNGGQPNQAGCKCSDGWKGTCCNSQVKCTYPGKPRNGQIVGRWPAIFGAIVMFSCDDGFYLDGQEMLECQADGKWTHAGAIPKCQRITCAMPKENENVKIMNRNAEYMYGEEVVYRCDRGYVLQGPETRTCVKRDGATGKWTGFDPFCSTVDCGDPGLPLYGERNGTNFGFGGVVTFSCGTGYKLLGSQSMKCMSTGKWLGRTPECVQITCEAPFVPKNGAARLKRRSHFGAMVTFTCDPGYVLEGSKTLRCQADGNWNGTEPECKASSCGDPGIPVNGAKDGSVYFYPYNITYNCYTGYILKGQKEISCQSNGKWSSPKPTCEACLTGYYMDAIEAPGVCNLCPDHTHTLTEASTSKRQCVCDNGYMGPSGGPCTEIKCEKLYAPTDGTIDNCGNKMGDSCSFGCVDGNFIDKGTSTRTCQENGKWDGTEPHCSACPINTYKSDVRSCLPCPVNSNTDKTTGNMKDGCVCDKGFQGDDGGPCTDVNECLENDGKGSCADTCENRKGGYMCGCSIPGYKVSDDMHNCEVEKQCKNLTEAEAPDNGGLVCHWYREENSQQCSVRCNKKFEFPSRVNNYETCGPSTGYIWSFRSENKKATFDGCIPEFFPGFNMESEISYFTRNCSDLNETEKHAVYTNFKKVLDEKQVCKRRATKVCNIENMGIICGKRTKRRTKRGTIEDFGQVNFGFDVKSINVGEDPRKDCPRICRFLSIPAHACDRLCVVAYKRFLKAAVMYARIQLNGIYKSAERRQMKFNAANRDFYPTSVISQSDVDIQCSPGMKGDAEAGWCVPCESGTFWNATNKECVACPTGTFQPFKNQTTCIECPLGSMTKKPGSYFCDVCPKGLYGQNCRQRCQCEHGTCHPRDGTCMCQSGWEGVKCDTDANGCQEPRCFQGVTCTDVPAPGIGFQCGACPAGFRGDGANCARVSEL